MDMSKARVIPKGKAVFQMKKVVEGTVPIGKTKRNIDRYTLT